VKSIDKMTQGELAAFVQSNLRKFGVDVVLSGGATVAIYSNNKYVSNDLDFIDLYFSKRQLIREAMESMGFKEKGRYFRHPDTKYFVEFPPGPLTVGEDAVTDIHEIKYSTGLLRIISPTDCVKDRLACYYHWGDGQCLHQALLVAQEHKIEIGKIKRWSLAEGKLDEFNEFKKRLARNKNK
jgi:hypothetical protein